MVEYFINHLLKFMTKSFIIVIGGNDFTMPNDYPSIQKLLDNPNLLYIYSQNNIGENPKLKSLPIGLDYHTLKFYKGLHPWSNIIAPIESIEQEKLLFEIKNSFKNLKDTNPLAVTNFHHAMSEPLRRRQYRYPIYETLKDKECIIWLPNQNREEFWKSLNDNMFVICPFGNGLDTHRIWEVLCLGRIPIVEKNILNKVYDLLPIIELENWNDITTEFLLEKFNNILANLSKNIYNFDRLYLSYWEKKLNMNKTKNMDPKNYTLLIAITTKNNEKTVESVFKNIEKYASLFKNYKALIVDGWSMDSTKSISDKWCEKDKNNRTFILQKHSNLNRPESLAEARNTVLEFYKDFFNESTLLLLLDSDTPNVPSIDLEGFLTCFKKNDWIALFPNQPTKYYDLYALRDSTLDMDYQIKYRNLKWNGEMQNALKKYESPKFSKDGFWPVKSAFGGAGLYKTDIIKNTNALYKSTTNLMINNINYIVPVCEHVPFHETLSQNGGNMFVNCNWINGDND
jgi:hypothetical protein